MKYIIMLLDVILSIPGIIVGFFVERYVVSPFRKGIEFSEVLTLRLGRKR
jgi:ABC-type phosphate transport system permease subunit